MNLFELAMVFENALLEFELIKIKEEIEFQKKQSLMKAWIRGDIKNMPRNLK